VELHARVLEFRPDVVIIATDSPILAVAVQRFEAEQDLKRELDEIRTQLADRKDIERAKGIIHTNWRPAREISAVLSRTSHAPVMCRL